MNDANPDQDFDTPIETTNAPWLVSDEATTSKWEAWSQIGTKKRLVQDDCDNGKEAIRIAEGALRADMAQLIAIGAEAEGSCWAERVETRQQYRRHDPINTRRFAVVNRDGNLEMMSKAEAEALGS